MRAIDARLRTGVRVGLLRLMLKAVKDERARRMFSKKLNSERLPWKRRAPMVL